MALWLYRNTFAAAVLVSLVAVAASCLAQADKLPESNNRTPVAITAYENRHYQPEVFESADGNTTATLYQQTDKRGIYLKGNISGLTQKLDFEHDLHCEFCSVDELSFSPDSATLFFEVNQCGNCMGELWSIKTDGTELTFVAGSAATAISSPIYSPDGSKIMVSALVTNGKADAEGHRDASGDKRFVAILYVNARHADPEMIAEGVPEFWSANGESIYFTAPDRSLSRVTLSNKNIQPIGITAQDVIGHLRDNDAAFVRKMNSAGEMTVNLVDLQTGVANGEAGAIIPMQDRQGRALSRIEDRGNSRLLLTYGGSRHRLYEGASVNTQTIFWQRQ